MPDTSTDIRVLVVDDDEGMVVTLRDVLGSMGYPVDVAFSGHEALERVRERRPDCILMDIRMPGMTGVEAYREIKQLAPESFVIFMTAYSRSSWVEEASREGAAAVFTKPLELEGVLNIIEVENMIDAIRQAVDRRQHGYRPQGLPISTKGAQ